MTYIPKGDFPSGFSRSPVAHWIPVPPAPTEQQLAVIQGTILRLQSFARRATDLETRNHIENTIIPATHWVITHYHLIPIPGYDASEDQHEAYRNKMKKLEHLMAFINNNAQSNNKPAFDALLTTLEGRSIDTVETYIETNLIALPFQHLTLG